MIVYAPSYQSIFLIGWLLANGKKVSVLTGHKNLIKLFTEWKVEVLELPEKFSTSYKFIGKIKKNKRLLISVLDSLEETDLYFAFNAYDIRGFFIVKWWLKNKGNVYWKDLDPIRPKWEFNIKDIFSIGYIKTLILGITIFLTLKVRLSIVGTKIPVLGVTTNYLKSIGVNTLNISDKSIRDKALCFFPKHLEATKILIVTEGPSAYQLSFKYSDYWNIVTNLFKQYNDISIKFHPSLDTTELEIKSPFPPYIPVEFILHNSDIVLGVYSAALIAAAKNQNTTVISLSELIEWNSVEKKQEALAFLNSDKIAKDKIKHPKTINELFTLLMEGK